MTAHALDLTSLSQTDTFLDLCLERDVFYGRPLLSIGVWALIRQVAVATLLADRNILICGLINRLDISASGIGWPYLIIGYLDLDWMNRQSSELFSDVIFDFILESGYIRLPLTMATENSRFEGDKFPVLCWINPENSRSELMTYVQANTFFIARNWPKLAHLASTVQNSIAIAF